MPESGESGQKYPVYSFVVLRLFGLYPVIIGIISLMLMLVVSFYINMETTKSQKWVSHTYEVRDQIDHLFSILQDMETGQRGYIITGEKSYLEPYQEAKKHVFRDAESLRGMTSDNPFQQENYEKLLPLIRDKMSELDKTIQLRKTGRLAEAVSMVKSDQGKEIMDRLRILLVEMHRHENRLLAQREENFKNKQLYSIIIFVLLVLMILAISGIIIKRIREFVIYREKSEIALKHARNEAQSASEAKSLFLSSMSHELRTPLNGIIGFTDLVLMDEPNNPLSEEQRSNIEHVHVSAMVLLKLVNQVLDYDKIIKDRFELSVQRHSVAEITQPCLGLFHTICGKYGVTVIDRTAEFGAREVMVDILKGKQIFMNLVSNAIRYNHPGGTVTLKCVKTDDGYMRFMVIDTGPGIPEEQQKKIFEPFDRLSRIGGSIEGTGIGLSISRELVEKMKGRIGMESEPGKGSTFWFDLPLV